MSDRHNELDVELLNMRRRMRRLTATNVLLAVVVLTFGGAGAAYALAAANSVNTNSIIDGQVYNPDIHDRAVTGAKVLNDSLTGSDINEDSLHPHLAFALVKQSGALAGGTPGTTSSRNATTESYSVVFPFSVAGCAASADAGAFAGYDGYALTSHPYNFNVGGVDAHTVSIDWQQGTTRVSTAFMLSLTCP